MSEAQAATGDGVIEVGGRRFRGKKVVRELAGRRRVIYGEFEGHPAYLKQYLPAPRAQRHWQRELNGLRTLANAGIPAPQVLDAGQLDGGYYVLLAAIEPALRFTELPSEAQSAATQQLYRAVADHHTAGLVQHDIHVDNFLWSGDTVHTLDGDGVARLPRWGARRAALRNFALLLAQFPLSTKQDWLQAVQTYSARRGIAPPAADAFTRLVHAALWRRMMRWRKKVLRNCSAVAVERAANCRRYFVRASVSPGLRELLQDPDASLATSPQVLKDGQTCTVWRVDLDGGAVVIKRYNSKGLWHALSRWLRPTRALVSWRNAHLLSLLEVPTPPPLAALVCRQGWRRTTYFVADYVPAEQANRWFRPPERSVEDKRVMAGQVDALVDRLGDLRIRHGDLKAANFLIGDDGPLLIDLDSMHFHRWAMTFQRGRRKDLARFARNWDTQPELAALFRKRQSN